MTEQGEELMYAIQSILDQVSNIEKQYARSHSKVMHTSISVIHYFFMGEVFAEIVNRIENRDVFAYQLRLLDADTLEVINDVVNDESEIGIISYTDHNKNYIMRELKKNSLECFEIVTMQLSAFVRGQHPVLEAVRANGKITMKDLEPYPYASIWQSHSSQFYFTEEGIFLPSNQKKVYVSDSGAMRELLKETDAFAMGTGIMPSDVNLGETCAIHVEDTPMTSICWIRRGGREISGTAREFLQICASKLGRTLEF